MKRGVDRRERFGKLGLLHLGVEVDVDRSHGRGVRDQGGTDDRLAGGRRNRLVIPLGVVTLIAPGRARCGSISQGRRLAASARPVGAQHMTGAVAQALNIAMVAWNRPTLEWTAAACWVTLV
jgi:hypothetical protein